MKLADDPAGIDAGNGPIEREARRQGQAAGGQRRRADVLDRERQLPARSRPGATVPKSIGVVRSSRMYVLPCSSLIGGVAGAVGHLEAGPAQLRAVDDRRHLPGARVGRPGRAGQRQVELVAAVVHEARGRCECWLAASEPSGRYQLIAIWSPASRYETSNQYQAVQPDEDGKTVTESGRSPCRRSGRNWSCPGR